MAILQSALGEPLLSRQQSSVLRDIARAAQLNQGLQELLKIQPLPDTQAYAKAKPKYTYGELKDYLEFEIQRVLMQIKVPKTQTGDQSPTTQS